MRLHLQIGKSGLTLVLRKKWSDPGVKEISEVVVGGVFGVEVVVPQEVGGSERDGDVERFDMVPPAYRRAGSPSRYSGKAPTSCFIYSPLIWFSDEANGECDPKNW